MSKITLVEINEDINQWKIHQNYDLIKYFFKMRIILDSFIIN